MVSVKHSPCQRENRCVHEHVRKPLSVQSGVRDTTCARATSRPEIKEWLSCSFMVKKVEADAVPPKPYNAFVRFSPAFQERSKRVMPWETPMAQITSLDTEAGGADDAEGSPPNTEPVISFARRYTLCS